LNNYNVEELITLNDFKDILHGYVQRYITVVHPKHCDIPRNDTKCLKQFMWYPNQHLN